MSQSKKNSLWESVVNTFIGMLITMIFSPLIYWMCDVEMSWPQMSYAMILFTILSILRNYGIRRFFERRSSLRKPNIIKITKRIIEPEEMNEWQKTDIVLNVQNRPFITLTESKMPNLWYHDEIDEVFCLTSKGFKVIKGSKKILFERGLGRFDIRLTDPLTFEQKVAKFNDEHFPDMYMQTESMTLEEIIEKYPNLTEDQIKNIKAYKP